MVNDDKNELVKLFFVTYRKNISKNRKIIFRFIKNAGYPELKFEKKVDFEKLYNEKFN